MSFEPGEHLQEIYTDPKTGIRHDANGNPIQDAGPQSYGANDVAYYTANGQPLRYASIYPGPTNVHVNQALTDFSVAYEVDTGLFVAPELAPVRTVSKRSDTYFTIAPDDVTRDYGNKLQRAIGAAANEISQGFSTTNYTSVDYAVRDFVPDKVASNADEALQLMQNTTQFLTTVQEMGYERRVVNTQFSTALVTNQTFSSATSGGAGTIASSTLTSRYIHQAINTARQAVALANNGKLPNVLALDFGTAQRIAAASEVAQQVVYKMGEEYLVNGGWQGKNHGLPNELYGLKVAVVGAVTNSAQRGQTANNAFLLNSNPGSGTMGLFIVEPPALKTRNNITTFRVGGITVRSYRDESRKGTWIEVEIDQTEAVTNSNGGYLLTSC